jgi:hypothetical protein
VLPSRAFLVWLEREAKWVKGDASLFKPLEAVWLHLTAECCGPLARVRLLPLPCAASALRAMLCGLVTGPYQPVRGSPAFPALTPPHPFPLSLFSLQAASYRCCSRTSSSGSTRTSSDKPRHRTTSPTARPWCVLLQHNEGARACAGARVRAYDCEWARLWVPVVVAVLCGLAWAARESPKHSLDPSSRTCSLTRPSTSGPTTSPLASSPRSRPATGASSGSAWSERASRRSVCMARPCACRGPACPAPSSSPIRRVARSKACSRTCQPSTPHSRPPDSLLCFPVFSYWVRQAGG